MCSMVTKGSPDSVYGAAKTILASTPNVRKAPTIPAEPKHA